MAAGLILPLGRDGARRGASPVRRSLTSFQPDVSIVPVTPGAPTNEPSAERAVAGSIARDAAWAVDGETSSPAARVLAAPNPMGAAAPTAAMNPNKSMR